MKLLLALLAVTASTVVCEPPAPYAPSGWRPNGPSFELPERNPVDPRNKPQKQEYLPPSRPNQEYGPPEDDVSVQGLPAQEQLPIFQLSPVNGQQYVGPAFNNDLKSIEQQQRDALAQREVYRAFARQKQLEDAIANNNNNRNNPVPRQFVPQSTTTTTQKPNDYKTTSIETTTESLNQGEVENKDDKEKVSVEVTKQTIQEYPPELFLKSLAQLQLQNQYAPVQLGQLRAPIYLEPTQKQVLEYNAAQLLAQQQYVQIQQQLIQAQLQAQSAQPQETQPQVQAQQPFPSYNAPDYDSQVQVQQPVAQYQPTQTQYQPAAYQPVNQYENVQPVQTMPQQVFLQPQPNQLLPRPLNQQNEEQSQSQPQQPQFVYQYQPQYPSQLQYQQPLTSYQADIQPQYFVQNPAYQQQVVQGQGSLQSGLDVNQQGNDIDQTEDKNNDDANTSTAVATAFGARTQPRVYATYGAPVPVPRVQVDSDQFTTETNSKDDGSEGSPTVAEATAAARGERRRPAKLRNRQGRVRPIFTLDKSGHLVLAQEQ